MFKQRSVLTKRIKEVPGLIQRLKGPGSGYASFPFTIQCVRFHFRLVASWFYEGCHGSKSNVFTTLEIKDEGCMSRRIFWVHVPLLTGRKFSSKACTKTCPYVSLTRLQSRYQSPAPTTKENTCEENDR